MKNEVIHSGLELDFCQTRCSHQALGLRARKLVNFHLPHSSGKHANSAVLLHRPGITRILAWDRDSERELLSLFKAASSSFEKKGAGVGTSIRDWCWTEEETQPVWKGHKGTTMTRKPASVHKAQVNRWAPSARSLLYAPAAALFSFLQESCLVSLNQQSESLWCI